VCRISGESFTLGTITGDDLRIVDAPQPLPEWAIRLHELITDNFGHPSLKAEWHFSGEDTLKLLREIR